MAHIYDDNDNMLWPTKLRTFDVISRFVIHNNISRLEPKLNGRVKKIKLFTKSYVNKH